MLELNVCTFAADAYKHLSSVCDCELSRILTALEIMVSQSHHLFAARLFGSGSFTRECKDNIQ